MKQKGLSPIYLLLGSVIFLAILLAPVPYYQSQVLCVPCLRTAVCPPCPKSGWKLGNSLWKHIVDYFSYINKPTRYAINITTSPIPTPTNKSSSSAETVNWKIYKDPEGTFEIKYPSFIVLKPFESLDMNNKVISRGIGLHPNFVSDNGEVLIQGKNAEIFNLSINLVNNIQHLTNEDIKNNLLKSPHSLSPDNNSAWKQIKNTIRPYKNGDIAGYYYLAPEETAHPTVIEGIHQNKYFTIRYEGLGGQEVSKGIEQIVDQILSTFRFLP